MTSLHYDVDQTVKESATDFQYFPEFEVREKMFTPRINTYRNLHRPGDIFESLYVSGLSKQDKDRSLASANSFREINKLWDGFTNKQPNTGNRPPWNVFASATSHSAVVRSDESRCLWKKKEEENTKRREDYEARKKRFARPATPPPLTHTESSLNKAQGKVTVAATSQIMPRRLSTPYTREQEQSVARKERELSARRESVRKSASVQEVVQRLSSRPVIDTKKKVTTVVVPATQKRPAQRNQPAAPFEQQHSTHSSIVLDHTHNSYIEFEDHRKSIAYEIETTHEAENTAVVRQGSDHSSAHADLMQSVTYEVEGTPSPKRPSDETTASPSVELPPHASSSSDAAKEIPVKPQEQQQPLAQQQQPLAQQQQQEQRETSTSGADFRQSIDQILIEANMADLSPVQPAPGSAPRRRFKELEVAED